MRSFSRRVGYVLGAALTMAALALPGGAASAATGAHVHFGSPVSSVSVSQSDVVPFSASGCGPNEYPELQVQQCTQVIGGGLKVDSVSGRAINVTDFALNELHIEIYGPDGTILKCPQFNLPAYRTSPQCNWNNPVPNYDVAAGNYCSRTWAYTGSGYRNMGSFCIDVHT